MACDLWTAKLDAYVDGELCSLDAASLAQHLRQCAGCSADALERVQMKRAVAVAGKRYQPSAQLREKIQQSLVKRGRHEGSWVWKIVALPATLVLVLSLAVSLYVDHEKTLNRAFSWRLAESTAKRLPAGSTRPRSAGSVGFRKRARRPG